MKSKLILIMMLALGSMAHAQGFASHVSLGGGLQGVFAGSTFTKDLAIVTNPPYTQSTTNSVGAVGDLRFDFGHHSAMDLSVTFNRASEISLFSPIFSGGGHLGRVQTDNTEIIGSYIFRLPSNKHVKPYALVGGGAVHFSPTGAETTGSTPQTQTTAAFAYGFGFDFPMSQHLAMRLQYRGLVRTSPDFGLHTTDNFGSELKAHVAEPSIQIVYHF